MYLLDSNVFISAKNAHYGMDFAPGFWTWAQKAHAAGVLYTAEAVREELLEGQDELADWIKRQPKSFYKPVDAPALGALQELSKWANTTPQYTPAAVATFLNNADYYLIGQAKSLKFTLVTHEMPAPAAKKRILIPDACQAMGVQYCLPWTMLRNQNVRLVL